MTRRKLSFPKDHILCDIKWYLKREILCSHDAKSKEKEKFPLVIRANNNNMRSEIKCVYHINFVKPHNWLAARVFIESLIEITTVTRVGRVDKYQYVSINIMNITYRVQRDRGCVHMIHEFSPSVPPNIYKISERSRSFTFRSLYGALRIWRFAVDQNNQLLDFLKGKIIVKLHVWRC